MSPCLQTEDRCAKSSFAELRAFTRELEGRIVDYKRQTLTEDAPSRNANDLPMLRLYLQYSIATRWLETEVEDPRVTEERERVRTTKISEEARELEERCRLMTVPELLFRKEVLRLEILEWKRRFTEANGRSPDEDDVFDLKSDSTFTEYGVVSLILEAKKEEEAAALGSRT